ncbi:Ppx/GppA phosphatase family-domain-containing protein [Microdochium trichocladiopsis]|uniref:Ppx/GppA phosphatase family-domain-containing protein n=1 Tax=Microdochium trichocladiopsis TaxID=1682393 RepID=A0A9P8Y2U5_9PEZI|nr:Ppx/GppA phosphatase family-domain-containing protein [Microdochium trichocladiopsis]KAH7026519.1 Ppx/GppA phosphatase family-domain-containing protein [Microdochium trichocladiopsis]
MELITLDNFAAIMPAWHPGLSNHLYALVDMGSNGIRFTISDLTPPRSRLLRCIYRERADISLFDALSTTPPGEPLRFPEEVIFRVPKVLSRFKGIALAYGVPLEHISIFATEAMRKASNAAAMLEAIYAASGLQVQVIAPEVETLFGAMGARSAYGHVKGLFLDLGGGSVQMSYIDTRLDNYELQAARYGKSLPFGAARLSNILRNQNTDTQALARNELQDGVLRSFTDLRQQYQSLADTQAEGGDGIDLYLCGGGFRGYGSMLMHSDPIQPYPIPTIGGYTVDGQRFRNVVALREINATHDGKISGMSKRRRLQFPAVAEVVEALAAAIPRIRSATFCSGGNREGALLMRLPGSIRESNPLSTLTQAQDETRGEVAKAVLEILEAAVPAVVRQWIPTIFSLRVAPLFIDRIWSRQGDPEESNAALELRHSLTFDPNCPGLTNIARTVLALTTSARWSTKQAPADEVLHQNLRALASSAHPEAVFWAEYIGTVAATLCKIVPVAPVAPGSLRAALGIDANLSEPVSEGLPKVLKLQLTVPETTRQALGYDTLVESLKQLGKQKIGLSTISLKVEVEVSAS